MGEEPMGFAGSSSSLEMGNDCYFPSQYTSAPSGTFFGDEISIDI
jgi:hypothetical protein